MPRPIARRGDRARVAWDDLLAACKEAEVLGFDSAWVFDHFIPIFFAQDIMPAFKCTAKSRAGHGFPASLTRPGGAGIFRPPSSRRGPRAGGREDALTPCA